MAFPSGLAILVLLISFILSPPSAATTFKCSSPLSCRSLIDYIAPNTTTLSEIKTLFGVKNLRAILGANSLPVSTSSNFRIYANQTIKIPFSCSCRNGRGTSAKSPVYTVQKDDGLYHVAAEVFSGLVTYQQIADRNNISDPNRIITGQELLIPLPCSCDEVNGLEVVHYGHVVKAGSSVEGIAQEYGMNGSLILAINGITDSKSIQAGAVLDIPLRACASMVGNNSLDYPLLVSNDTYIYTANNCVMCQCNAANNWTLQCYPTQLIPSNNSGWSECPASNCQADLNLMLGNFTGGSCDTRACVYAGYDNRSIHTVLLNSSSCPAPSNDANRVLQCSSWNFTLCLIQLMLFLISML